MEPNWMLARSECVSVREESSHQSLHSQKSVSLTLGVLSDKARLLWRLRGMRSLADCACLSRCVLCTTSSTL